MRAGGGSIIAVTWCHACLLQSFTPPDAVFLLVVVKLDMLIVPARATQQTTRRPTLIMSACTRARDNICPNALQGCDDAVRRLEAEVVEPRNCLASPVFEHSLRTMHFIWGQLSCGQQTTTNASTCQCHDHWSGFHPGQRHTSTVATFECLKAFLQVCSNGLVVLVQFRVACFKLVTTRPDHSVHTKQLVEGIQQVGVLRRRSFELLQRDLAVAILVQLTNHAVHLREGSARLVCPSREHAHDLVLERR